MDPLSVAHYASYGVLAVLASLLARREPAHRPIAAYICWMVTTDLLRLGLDLVREGATRPYEGIARFAFHLDQILVFSWSFLFVAVCAHYFLRAHAWSVLGAWFTVLVICLNYPLVSRDVLIWIYQAVALGCVIVSWAIILWGILRTKTLMPTAAHLVIVLYACTDVVVNLVPYARGMLANWDLARFANILLFTTCIVIHVLRLRAKPAVVPA